jgi:tetratricopeptide (TPR) repeat protein
MVQTMGEEFGPFPLEFLREKLSNGLSPSTRVIVVEDGRHVAYSNVGDELLAQDNPADALRAFRGHLAATELKAKSGSGLSGAQSDLAAAYERFGDALSKQGDADQAIETYRAGLAVAETQAALQPRFVGYKTLLAALNYALAVNGDEPARRYALVVATLTPLASDLNSRQKQTLTEATAALAKLGQGAIRSD